jgi:hypothetical protein
LTSSSKTSTFIHKGTVLVNYGSRIQARTDPQGTPGVPGLKIVGT